MSDGPHRSLPMGQAWKRVAERADSGAFSADEVRAEIVPAVERDCRAEINPALLRDVRAALDEHSSLLFKTDVKPVMDGFRAQASSSMDRAILDNVCALSAEDRAGADVLLKALEAVVAERAARGVRQVEEHYLRRSTAGRANHLRDRMEDAIMTMNTGEVAVRLINRCKPASAPAKRRSLDDGVELP
jgi:hypothetical protein